MQNYYKSGEWNVICDVCGRKFKSGQVMKRWDGAIVCKNDWESRHSLDFLRARQEKINVPYVRDEITDVFVGPKCTLDGQTAIAGYAVAGCSIAGRTAR